MIGIVGFFVAALTFLIYGYTSYELAERKKTFDRASYLFAYLLIAFACVVWGMSINLSMSTLSNGVLFGDYLLLAATIALLLTLVKKEQKLLALAGGLLISGLLIWTRSATLDTNPVVSDGILVFNTPRVFGGLLALVVLVIWVRANMHYFTEAVDKKLQPIVRPAYFSMNVLGFISVTAFLFARKSLTIIVAFAMLVGSFIMLAVLNYYVLHQKGAHHGK